jgi:hypothetical protein
MSGLGNKEIFAKNLEGNFRFYPLIIEFKFRELNDIYQKQEMVPYNISLGGGTLGLSESKLVFGDKIYELEDPEYISKYFNKRFYGELKTFKFYNGPLDINNIRNNYYYNKNNK